MPKERKSPQEKKALEYTKDHFTFGFNSSRAFPRVWKQKKTHINREYRRKSGVLIAQAKPGVDLENAKTVAGEITTAHLKNSVLRKQLHKAGTVSVGEKIKLKLTRRKETVGRRANSHKHYDQEAAHAVRVLTALEGERLAGVIRQASLLCQPGNHEERFRLSRSNADLNRALTFLVNACWGSARERDALRRNQQICEAFESLVDKANRLLNQPKLDARQKIDEQKLFKNKLRGLRKDRDAPAS